jgi:hypothetical protein
MNFVTDLAFWNAGRTMAEIIPATQYSGIPAFFVTEMQVSCDAGGHREVVCCVEIGSNARINPALESVKNFQAPINFLHLEVPILAPWDEDTIRKCMEAKPAVTPSQKFFMMYRQALAEEDRTQKEILAEARNQKGRIAAHQAGQAWFFDLDLPIGINAGESTLKLTPGMPIFFHDPKIFKQDKAPKVFDSPYTAWQAIVLDVVDPHSASCLIKNDFDAKTARSLDEMVVEDVSITVDEKNLVLERQMKAIKAMAVVIEFEAGTFVVNPNGNHEALNPDLHTKASNLLLPGVPGTTSPIKLIDGEVEIPSNCPCNDEQRALFEAVMTDALGGLVLSQGPLGTGETTTTT